MKRVPTGIAPKGAVLLNREKQFEICYHIGTCELRHISKIDQLQRRSDDSYLLFQSERTAPRVVILAPCYVNLGTPECTGPHTRSHTNPFFRSNEADMIAWLGPKRALGLQSISIQRARGAAEIFCLDLAYTAGVQRYILGLLKTDAGLEYWQGIPELSLRKVSQWLYRKPADKGDEIWYVDEKAYRNAQFVHGEHKEKPLKRLPQSSPVTTGPMLLLRNLEGEEPKVRNATEGSFVLKLNETGLRFLESFRKIFEATIYTDVRCVRRFCDIEILCKDE